MKCIKFSAHTFSAESCKSDATFFNCSGDNGELTSWDLLFSFDFLLILFLSLKADSETQEKIATLHEFLRIKAKPDQK